MNTDSLATDTVLSSSGSLRTGSVAGVAFADGIHCGSIETILTDAKEQEGAMNSEIEKM